MWNLHRENGDRFPRAILLCEPAQSKCAWTLHKSHFVWKCSGEMPNARNTTSIDNTGPQNHSKPTVRTHQCGHTVWEDISAQGIMYWKVLLWKQPAEAMLKLVCWFYFQVLAVSHVPPWIQVTLWEGARTTRKTGKSAHVDDVHETWLRRHGQ